MQPHPDAERVAGVVQRATVQCSPLVMRGPVVVGGPVVPRPVMPDVMVLRLVVPLVVPVRLPAMPPTVMVGAVVVAFRFAVMLTAAVLQVPRLVPVMMRTLAAVPFDEVMVMVAHMPHVSAMPPHTAASHANPT